MTVFYKYEALHVNKQQTKTNLHKPKWSESMYRGLIDQRHQL